MGVDPGLIRAVRGPITLITLGVLFTLDHFTPYGFGQTWPVLLIVFGLLSLMRRGAGTPASPPWGGPPGTPPWGGQPGTPPWGGPPGAPPWAKPPAPSTPAASSGGYRGSSYGSSSPAGETGSGRPEGGPQ